MIQSDLTHTPRVREFSVNLIVVSPAWVLYGLGVAIKTAGEACFGADTRKQVDGLGQIHVRRSALSCPQVNGSCCTRPWTLSCTPVGGLSCR